MSHGFHSSKGGMLIKGDIWTGAGTILSKGLLIGAMSLVRQEVPEFSIYAGNSLDLMGMRR